MSLSVFETIAVLSSYFVAVWLFFWFDFYLDRRAAKKKSQAEWKKLSLASKAKRTGKAIAKIKTVKSVGKAVGKGAKIVGDAVGVPVNGVGKAASAVANKAGDVAGKTADAAEFVVGAAGEAAKTISKVKTIKKLTGKMKDAGKAVGGFFKLEAIEEEEEPKKEDDDG
jgi:hypothetical protein